MTADSSLLQMRQKRAEDQHGAESYIPVVQPDGGSNGLPSIRGRGIDAARVSTLSFDIYLVGTQWWMNPGFVDGIPVTGTGAVILPAEGGSLWLEVDISLEQGEYRYTVVEDDLFDLVFVDYDTGPYTLGEPVVTVYPAGEAPAGGPGRLIKQLCDFDAEGVPSFVATRADYRVSENLSELIIF